MIFGACIIAVALILSAIIIANTIENVIHDFANRMEALEHDD